MSEDLDNIGSEKLDAFKEIGNIGAGSAATALSKILNKQIVMSIPDVLVVPFNSVTNILNGPETNVVGLLVDMSGDMDGFILLVLDLNDAINMLSMVLPEDMRSSDVNETLRFNDIEQSALLEISNILVGSFISAISTFTMLEITPSAPQLAIDMLGAIMMVATVEYGNIGDSVLFLKTEFSNIEDVPVGHFFLIPNYSSYKILLRSLGME